MTDKAPYPWKTRPFEHQRRAVKRLWKHDGRYALLWDPGAAKTKAVLDYIGYRHHRGARERWLIIAPLSVCRTWVREIELHYPFPHATYLHTEGSVRERAERIQLRELLPEATNFDIINYDAWSASSTYEGPRGGERLVIDDLVAAVRGGGFTGIICDEAHWIKNPLANRSRAIRRATREEHCRIAMTGTPMPNNYMDVWGIWRWMNPERFGTRKADFEDRYAQFGGWMGKQIVAWRNEDHLKKEILKDAYPLDKREAIDLPPTMDVITPVHFTPQEAEAYRSMAKESLIALEEGLITAPQALVRALRLRQITSGSIGPSHVGDSKLRAALERVSDLTANGHQVVVFCHFREDVERLYSSLDQDEADMIMGDTPQDLRDQLLGSFLRGRTRVLVAQQRTVGIGVNELAVAHHAIFYSLSERRDDLEQAKGRLDRQGQTHPVTFEYLIVPNSVDEALYNTLVEKKKLEDELLDRRYYTLEEDA